MYPMSVQQFFYNWMIESDLQDKSKNPIITNYERLSGDVFQSENAKEFLNFSYNLPNQNKK